jgi:phosphatidylglycerol---prolipoprotein diacylglyceryl transferase
MGDDLPHGMVPTTVPVYPLPLYEALAAVLIAAVLWRWASAGTRPQHSASTSR